jgi:hypothetical protein
MSGASSSSCFFTRSKSLIIPSSMCVEQVILSFPDIMPGWELSELLLAGKGFALDPETGLAIEGFRELEGPC